MVLTNSGGGIEFKRFPGNPCNCKAAVIYSKESSYGISGFFENLFGLTERKHKRLTVRIYSEILNKTKTNDPHKCSGPLGQKVRI